MIFSKDLSIDLKYILGILNSTLINYIHSKNHNSTYISFPSLYSLPFAIADKKTQDIVVELVSKILTARKEGLDTQDLENGLDEMVMDIYKLTDVEKDIIKNS